MRLKSRLMRPRPIRRVGATFVASLITLPPLQHPQCPEGVPAAGLTEAFELEERLPLVAVLQRPATVGAPAAADELDRIAEARIARCLDRLKVIESAQDVVVPARRE